jgi:hypothetical protein
VSTGAWIGIGVALFSVADTAIIMWAIIHFGWAPIPRRYPEQAPGAGAVRRACQSFRVDLLNFGFSIHVTVDETHLHLQPARFLRWVGGRTASIPWDEITITKRSRNGRWITVKVDKWTIQGPAWCLGLGSELE